nr:hypothetical protein [Pseudomonas aeruginosa]
MIFIDPKGLFGGAIAFVSPPGAKSLTQSLMDMDDPCGCLAKAFLGVEEAALITTEAATGPYVDKPRTGIAGGGKAGNKTSVVSNVAHSLYKKYGKTVGVKVIRAGGRIASRAVPYAGTALFVYDLSVYEECMKTCDEKECSAQ